MGKRRRRRSRRRCGWPRRICRGVRRIRSTTRLNRMLDEAGIRCASSRALCHRSTRRRWAGRVSPPGRYFRLLLLGYFEGLDSERAIAWRAADSLSIRSFLGLELHEPPPDHSTISRTRRLIDVETHRAVFTWVLQRLADAGLVKGQTIGIDATTLGSERGAAQHRAAGHGRDLSGVPDAAGAGLGHRDADARGPGAPRSEAEEEGLERRLDASARSRREDHEDERSPHAPGAQGRARRRSGDRRRRGRHGPGCGRGGHDDERRDADRSRGTGRDGRARRRGHPKKSSPTRAITATR